MSSQCITTPLVRFPFQCFSRSRPFGFVFVFLCMLLEQFLEDIGSGKTKVLVVSTVFQGNYDLSFVVLSFKFSYLLQHRPIPVSPWFASPSFVIPCTGLLPFGSIFIEMYFMFTAFWSYKFYYVYGFMLLVYAILAMVTLCTTIVAVYFVLNAENHRWQWIALLSAGSTSGYVFLYSIFYFFFKTQMTGLLQICFYFGYM